MKKLIIFILLGSIVYIYTAVHEHQKEKIVKKRALKLRKMNQYELNRALYKVRAVRARLRYALEKDRDEIEDEGIPEEDQPLEELKSEPISPAIPIRRDYEDYYDRQAEDEDEDKDEYEDEDEDEKEEPHKKDAEPDEDHDSEKEEESE